MVVVIGKLFIKVLIPRYAKNSSMFKYVNIALLFLFIGYTPYPLLAQQDSISLGSPLTVFPVAARLMSTDKVGNLYVVKDNNILIRYNAQGDSDRVFNEIKKGNITQIDAGNPLRILVFFQEYQLVVVLDNMLSKKQVIRLNNLGLYNVSSIANSADGSIWACDAAQGTLLKIDDKPSIRFSTPLRSVLEDAVNFQFMMEDERMLYAADSSSGVYKFDLYGFYNTLYHVPVNEFQWINQQLIYWHAPDLVAYHTEQLREKKRHIPNPETVLQVRVDRNRLFVRRAHQIELYRLD